MSSTAPPARVVNAFCVQDGDAHKLCITVETTTLGPRPGRCSGWVKTSSTTSTHWVSLTLSEVKQIVKDLAVETGLLVQTEDYVWQNGESP